MNEPTQSAAVHAGGIAPPLAQTHTWQQWLTVERTLYLVAVIVAVGLRLFALDLQPLAPTEAHQAWVAWQLAHGESIAAVRDVSPLLMSLNRLLFWLTTGGDALARLWPALAGAVLVLLPYGLRSHLGRGAALATSFLLAVSPLLVASARVVDGTSLAILGVVLALVGAARSLVPADDASPDPRLAQWPVWAGIGVGMALASASAAVTGLLAVAGGVLLFARHEVTAWGDSLRGLVRRALWPAVLTFVLGATGLLLFWPGLGAAGDLLARWLAHLAAPADAPPWWWPLGVLVQREPFVVLSSVIFVILWLARVPLARTWVVRTFMLWAGIALLVAVLGRDAGDLAMLVVPLCFLAGMALAALATWLRSQIGGETGQPGWREEWIILATSLVLSVTLLFYFTRWTYIPDTPVSLLLGSLALFGLLVLLFAVSTFWLGWRSVLGVLTIFLLVVTGFVQLRSVWMLNHDPALARYLVEPYRTVSSPDVRSLVATLEERSARQTGDEHRFHVEIVDGPTAEVWQWYLRLFDQVQVTMSPISTANPDAVITSLTEDPAVPLPGATGAPFVVTNRWTPAGLSGPDLVRWWLYAEADTPPESVQNIAWIRSSE